MFDGITTTSRLGNQDKAKGKLSVAAGLSYPVTQGTNLSPPCLMVFMDSNSPMCCRQPQLASAVVCQAQITSVNWPQVPLGGHAEMRNREPCGKFGAIGFA